MGILDSIFGKKKPTERPKPQGNQREREAETSIPTLMYNEPSAMQPYVDKKKPVLIIGGKYSQKQVILTSDPRQKVFSSKSGKTWPGVTIEMVMGGESEPVRTLAVPTTEKQETKAEEKEEQFYTILPNGDLLPIEKKKEREKQRDDYDKRCLFLSRNTQTALLLP